MTTDAHIIAIVPADTPPETVAELISVISHATTHAGTPRNDPLDQTVLTDGRTLITWVDGGRIDLHALDDVALDHGVQIYSANNDTRNQEASLIAHHATDALLEDFDIDLVLWFVPTDADPTRFFDQARDRVFSRLAGSVPVTVLITEDRDMPLPGAHSGLTIELLADGVYTLEPAPTLLWEALDHAPIRDRVFASDQALLTWTADLAATWTTHAALETLTPGPARTARIAALLAVATANTRYIVTAATLDALPHDLTGVLTTIIDLATSGTEPVDEVITAALAAHA